MSGLFRECPANHVVLNIALEQLQDAWFEHMGFRNLIAYKILCEIIFDDFHLWSFRHRAFLNKASP